MSFKTIAGGFNGAFWWYGPLSEDREKIQQIYQNYLLALMYSLKLLIDVIFCYLQENKWYSILRLAQLNLLRNFTDVKVKYNDFVIFLL